MNAMRKIPYTKLVRLRLLLFLLVNITQISFSQEWVFLGPNTTPIPLQDSGKMSPHGIGRLHSLVLLNNKGTKIVVGSSTGGSFYSKNKGKTWTPAPPYLYQSGVNAILAINKKKYWLATCSNHLPGKHWGLGVLEWNASQKTMQATGFIKFPSEYDRCCLYDMKRHPTNKKEIWILSESKVWKTEDLGITWSLILEDTKGLFRNILFNNSNKNEAWIVGAKVYHSQNGGKSFQETTHSLQSKLLNFNIERVSLTYFGEKNETLFALVMAKFVYLLRSDDGGKTWNESLPLTGNFGLHPFGIKTLKSKNKQYLVFEGVRSYLSADTGKSLQQLTFPLLGPQYVHDDIRATVFNKKGHIYFAHDGGISVSENMGKSWTSLNGSGLRITQCYGMSNSEIAPDVIYAGTLDMSSLIFKNKQWYCTSTLYADGGRARMHPFDTSLILVSASGFLYQNDSLHKQNWIYDHPLTKRGDFDFAMDFSPSGDYFLMATNHLFSRKTGSPKWENLTQQLPATKEITSFSLGRSNPNEIWFARVEPTWNPTHLSEKLYFSDDGGANWIDKTATLPILAWRFIRHLHVDPIQNEVVYAGLGDFDNTDQKESKHKVYVTRNKGVTWENISNGLPNFPVNYLCSYLNYVFAATDVGVYYCDTSTYQWKELGKGLPRVVVKEIHVNHKKQVLRVATFGNGIWEFDLSELSKQANR